MPPSSCISDATFHRRQRSFAAVSSKSGQLLDCDYRVCMDFEYFVRLANAGCRFHYLPRFIAAFRWHGNNISLSQADRRAQERRQVQLRFGVGQHSDSTFKLLADAHRAKRVMRKIRQRKHNTRISRSQDVGARHALAARQRWCGDMRKLSVLVIHNQYQRPGGEDVVVSAEMEMLRRAGHRVVPFIRSNAVIADYSPLQKAALAMSTTWNRKSYVQIRELIAKERPDVAHCHNLVPLVSPAAYDACKSAGIPVVQTLHNYRLRCPAGTLYNRGQICDDCKTGLSTGVARGCYRESRLQTATLATMLGVHRLLGTWTRSVDAYVALSRFSRDYFVAAGIPAGKIHVKPNFLPADTVPPRTGSGEYALFVGRLNPEKGVLEMLAAWQRLSHIPLVIAGDGPLCDQVTQMVGQFGAAHIKLMGQLISDDVKAQMKNARFLVFPSRWHEPFGMTLLEASACGIPAVAARIGGVPELVLEDETGLLFDPQNLEELAAKADWAWNNPAEMAAMGSAARQLYLQRFTAEKNYELLMNIYQAALSN